MSEDFTLPETREPVRIAARRLSWFRTAFRTMIERVEAQTGISVTLDEPALAECFVSWLRQVERMQPPEGDGRRAFYEHAAGMMLRELIEADPVTAAGTDGAADTTRPEVFWPEGFCYTVFCLNVAAAAIRQDMGDDVGLGSEFTDLRTWWSFRENTRNNPAYSVAFFKLFAGSEPDWEFPDLFRWTGESALSRGPIPRPLS